MKVIASTDGMHSVIHEIKAQGKTIAFVPTMGFLHEGHLSLMAEGRKKADVLVVSIYVNPTQFGPNEDLDRYPRDMGGDLKKCDSKGVDIVFTPTNDQMYGADHQTFVEVNEVTKDLCGAGRPGHFRGVTTIVAKLFNIIQPDVAIFGEKDFQQLATIRQMVKDLNYNIEIVGLPTVREKDNLAMSSRNKYLNPEQRQEALHLYKALVAMREAAKQGERSAEKLINKGKEIISYAPNMRLEYLKVCDPDTLDPVETINPRAIVAIAAKIGNTRLIDNILIRFEV